MIWILLQFLVEGCKTQIFKGVWNDGSASGNHVDTGLRPPFLGLGFMAKLENWKLPSWCFRGSWRPSGLIAYAVKKPHYYLCPWFPIPPLIEELSGTNVLSQAALAGAIFLYKCSMVARSNILYPNSPEPKHIQHKYCRCNTLRSLGREKKEHRHKFIWRVYLQLGAS